MSNKTKVVEQAVTFSQNGHKRVVLYARVSTDEQASNYSIPSQLEADRKYARQNDFEVVAEFADNFTGTIPIEQRPEGGKAFAMLKSGEADCLIAYTMDRIARPPEDGDEWDTPLLIRGLARLGKELHTVSRGQLKTDFASLLIAMLDAKSAGDERRKIIERTSRGRRTKAESGKVVGNGCAKYGYRYTYATVGTKTKIVGLEINPPEAKVITDIFDWYIYNGLTTNKIARQLSEWRVPTAGESRGIPRKRGNGMWSDSRIIEILSGEIYTGITLYGKDKIPVEVPAIIDRETWELAQAQRRDNRKTSRRKYEYLVSGRVTCGCGKAMVGSTNGGKGGRRYYYCSSIVHRHSGLEERECKEKSVRQDRLDSEAWDFAIAAKHSNAELLQLLERHRQEKALDAGPLAARLEETKALLENASKKIKRIVSLRSNATDDDEAEQYTADLETAKAEKASLDKKGKRLEQELREATVTEDDILAVLEIRQKEIEQLKAATFEERRRYVEHIDLRITVKDGKAKFTCKLAIPDREIIASGLLIAHDNRRMRK